MNFDSLNIKNDRWIFTNGGGRIHDVPLEFKDQRPKGGHEQEKGEIGWPNGDERRVNFKDAPALFSMALS